MPAARFRVGLFRRGRLGSELVGVAVFSHPPSEMVFPKWLGVSGIEGIELGRLVLLDDVEANGESWFLARAFRLLRTGLPTVRAVLSFSDPVPRSTTSGRKVLRGHVGTVYQALGGRYLGRSNPATLYLDREARVVSQRALSKIRVGDVGRDYAERQLVAAGAPVRNRGEDGRAYVRRVLAEGPFRKIRHPGNHAYAWPITSGVMLGAALPYPKQIEVPR